MTTVTMSPAMEAWLRAATDRAFEETRYAFGKSLQRTMTQPMPTLSSSTTFRIQTPSDGTREFTFTVSLTELTTTTTTPTSGFDLKGQ